MVIPSAKEFQNQQQSSRSPLASLSLLAASSTVYVSDQKSRDKTPRRRVSDTGYYKVTRVVVERWFPDPNANKNLAIVDAPNQPKEKRTTPRKSFWFWRRKKKNPEEENNSSSSSSSSTNTNKSTNNRTNVSKTTTTTSERIPARDFDRPISEYIRRREGGGKPPVKPRTLLFERDFGSEFFSNDYLKPCDTDKPPPPPPPPNQETTTTAPHPSTKWRAGDNREIPQFVHSVQTPQFVQTPQTEQSQTLQRRPFSARRAGDPTHRPRYNSVSANICPDIKTTTHPPLRPNNGRVSIVENECYLHSPRLLPQPPENEFADHHYSTISISECEKFLEAITNLKEAVDDRSLREAVVQSLPTKVQAVEEAREKLLEWMCIKADEHAKPIYALLLVTLEAYSKLLKHTLKCATCVHALKVKLPAGKICKKYNTFLGTLDVFLPEE